ncbi:MAG: SUMF1/EgtB/PvdO family nonheme iron enzyme, partial [Bacteroidales bacterium]
MKRVKNLLDIRNVSVLLVVVLLMFSCGNSGNGELVGVPGRSTKIEQPTPFGMTYIPGGSFVFGAGGYDPSYQLMNKKRVSISAFYMDETEITNNEYRQFVQYVIDSITRRMLAETFPEFQIESTTEDGEPFINWKTKIKPEQLNDEALADLYLPEEERFAHQKELNVKKLNYEYYTFDYQSAARKETTQEANTDGVYYGSFVNRPQAMLSRKQFVQKHVVNVYPDTLCWIFDWAYSFNEPMTACYFSSPMYDNYPIVGVNWKQANAFCVWRSNMYNTYMISKGYPSAQAFRLPTEHEWEYAARGGLEMDPYPWGGPYARNINGCLLGNFKPGRGDYTLDGALYPCIVGHYAPNDWGVYDMMGNVAEWCKDAYD